MVRKDGDAVRVHTRRGADWTKRFPRIVQATQKMKATSFLLDGEGIVYDTKGMPSFDLLHSRDYDREVSLCAFDLLEFQVPRSANNRSSSAKRSSPTFLQR
jgi:bifunctional non-homologous end joining protein LigD